MHVTTSVTTVVLEECWRGETHGASGGAMCSPTSADTNKDTCGCLQDAFHNWSLELVQQKLLELGRCAQIGAAEA